ncbi:MAG: sugar transferase [Planctomycetota bacterium]
MSELEGAIARPVSPTLRGAPGTVWGLEPVELHDRYWASARVRVVRPGGPAPEKRGPSMYLLCGPEDLVLFKLHPIVRRFVWAQAKMVRLRISDPAGERYSERVVTDAEGRISGIKRIYGGTLRGSVRVVLTPSYRVAEAWARSEEPVSAFRAARVEAGRDAILALTTRGRTLNAGSTHEQEAFVRELTQVWREVGAALDGVYEFAPRVWLHETAEIAQSARLVGPLWIGGAASIGADQIRVGPGLIPDAAGSEVKPPPIDWREQHPPGWRIVPRLRRRRVRRVSKRAFDVLFALAALLGTLPLYPLVMFLIWREDGRPFFFAHTRQTAGGRDFPCYKFRTMRRDAEKIKAELAKANQADGPQFFMRDDPRLLRCGKVLRRLQIDEFPQFFNVLLGHMSVVGPRPSPDKENQFCPAWREARLSVRPGITGLWQVRRTREPKTDFQEWIRYDLEYVQHESWALDLWIIYQTVRQIVLRG